MGRVKKEFLEKLDGLKDLEGFNWELLNQEHNSFIVKWRSDPDNLKFFGNNRKITMDEQKRFIHQYSSFDRIDLVLKSSEPIGVFSIKNLETKPEYGALIGKKNYRGIGIGLGAKISIFRYWFLDLNQKEIYVANKKNNLKVIESNRLLGFKTFEETDDFLMLRLNQKDFKMWLGNK